MIEILVKEIKSDKYTKEQREKMSMVVDEFQVVGQAWKEDEKVFSFVELLKNLSTENGINVILVVNSTNFIQRLIKNDNMKKETIFGMTPKLSNKRKL
jgi:ABC-type uncharacterized transport system substrate-binding protein